MSDKEKKTVTIFIYIADFDTNYQKEVIDYFKNNHSRELDSGLLLLAIADPNNYPPLKGLATNHGDSEIRVKWRSKQVADYAFMFHYARNMSTYYLQLEDDTITVSGWVSKIKQFIHMQTKTWATLQLSSKGFIGKLFKSKDLQSIAEYFMLFYDKMPVDWLYDYYIRLNVNMDIPMRIPTLFQHQGRISSLETKKESNIQDIYFEGNIHKYKLGASLPKVCTDMKLSTWNKPLLSEEKNRKPKTYIWTKLSKTGDQFSIHLNTPVNISKVHVYSVHTKDKHDVTTDAVIEYGYGSSPKLRQHCMCQHYATAKKCSAAHCLISIGEFHNSHNVSCVRISVNKIHKSEVTVSKILVKLL